MRSIGATSLKLDYRVVCGTELRMWIRSVLVMTDLDTGAAVPIPDWLRERLGKFQAPAREAA